MSYASYDEPIDPQDALEHPVGMAIGHALREGTKGAIMGLPAGFGISRALGRPGIHRFRDTMVGSAVGAGLGMIAGVGKARSERQADAMQLMGYKTAACHAAELAGRAYAQDLMKQATLTESVGRAGTAAAAAAARGLQAAGRGAETYAYGVNHETAGKVLGGAGLVGLGALGATHGSDLAQAALGAGGNDPMNQQFPYYPSQF